jgi:hypothetical protein
VCVHIFKTLKSSEFQVAGSLSVGDTHDIALVGMKMSTYADKVLLFCLMESRECNGITMWQVVEDKNELWSFLM